MEDKKNIYEKLFEIKKEIGKISKDSVNPFHNSKYMDINTLLEAAEPLFTEKNLMLLQPIEDGVLFTRIINMDDFEEKPVESWLELPKDNNPQKIGSAITYFRRYTLKSLLGIQEEDDDGNKAAKPTPVKPIKKPVLDDEQFNRLLKSDNLPMKNSASTKYSLTDQQELDLINNLEKK